VKEALAAGFTAIDTAAQPRHYREDLVGKALRETYAEGKLTRENIYVRRNRPRDINIAYISSRSKRNGLLPVAKTKTTCPTIPQPPSKPRFAHP
jgi:hypothetical protein